MKNISEILAGVEETPTTFEDYLKAYADPVGELINSYIPHGAHGDMDRYLYDPLYHYSENAGKRHRPLICFAACLAVGGDPDRAATAAAAIEHFHSAALIHDDIADEAELRRGEPCLHLTEGLGLAINMGDLALSMVNGPVVNDPLLEDAVKVRVIKELIAMTCRTVEGQALDLGWARDGRYDITPEDYLTMAIHKTAHYSGAVPLAVGAIVGGADDEIVEALRSYGLDTGLAFQIQDDLLNLVGTDEAKKKDFRSDITEGKRTLLVVWALAHLGDLQRDELLHILGRETTDAVALARAVELIDASGAVDYVRGYARELVADAKAHLVGARLEETPRDVLLSMADFFVERAG